MVGVLEGLGLLVVVAVGLGVREGVAVGSTVGTGVSLGGGVDVSITVVGMAAGVSVLTITRAETAVAVDLVTRGAAAP